MNAINTNELEEGTQLALDFDKIAKVARCGGVIPVVVQHAATLEVLMIGYTNHEAFREAVERRRLILWSTSRNELWEKGRTSGETFDLVEVFVNCEQNSLLYRVRPRRGGLCHTRTSSGEPRRGCYYRRLNFETGQLENLAP